MATRGILELDVYSVQDLHDRINLSHTTLIDALRKGELRGRYIGGAGGWRILKEDVIEWIKSGTNVYGEKMADLDQRIAEGKNKPRSAKGIGGGRRKKTVEAVEVEESEEPENPSDKSTKMMLINLGLAKEEDTLTTAP
jgi:hypothetical protein